jgi:hypothetical protein
VNRYLGNWTAKSVLCCECEGVKGGVNAVYVRNEAAMNDANKDVELRRI